MYEDVSNVYIYNNNTQKTVDRESTFPAGSIRLKFLYNNKCCWICERSIRLNVNCVQPQRRGYNNISDLSALLCIHTSIERE